MGLVLVSVHCGPFRGYDRRQVGSGRVEFTPTGGWRAVAGDSDYVPQTVKQPLESGETTVTLLAPTDVASGPIGYQVKVHVDPDLEDTYQVLMPTGPADGAVLELSSRDPDTGLLGGSTGGGSGGGFGGGGNGGFGA